MCPWPCRQGCEGFEASKCPALTRSISNTLSTEPFGFSAGLTASSAFSKLLRQVSFADDHVPWGSGRWECQSACANTHLYVGD